MGFDAFNAFDSFRLSPPALSQQTEAQNSKSSQKQKEHSKLYKRYGGEEKLPNRAAKASGDFSITEGVGQRVFRPGGIVQLNGVNVTALDEEYLPLDFNGRYLLFLHFIPATGSYKAVSGAASLQLKGRKTIKLTQQSLPPELETGADAASLLNSVRSSLSNPCAQ